MPGVIHDAQVFTTADENGVPIDKRPPGTVSAANCGIAAQLSIHRWLYGANESSAEIVLPADDGAGKPVGMEVAPNTARPGDKRARG